MHEVAGVALAAGAAVCFDGAVAWQAHEARQEEPMRAGHLLARLVRRRRWLVALALVRRELWASQTFPLSTNATDTVKVPRWLVEHLTDTLCYAA